MALSCAARKTQTETGMEHLATGFPEPSERYLAPTYYLDHDTPAVRAFAERAAGGAETATDKAARLFYAVRDEVRYDPYTMSDDREAYRASNVLAAGAAFCLPKANLLIAAARAVGIHAGLGLSTVTNHLCTERLRRLIGGHALFVDHGYAVLYLGGRWVKAAPTFNIELCDKFGVRPTDFDGTADALFQQYDRLGRRHMEYLADHGIWSDFDFARVIGDFRRSYPATLFGDLARERARNAARKADRFEDERPLV